MTRAITERDHAQLKQFIDATRTRVAALEARLAVVPSAGSDREEITLAIPVATIEPATFAADTFTAGTGNAFLVRYSSSGGDKFAKAAAARGKIKVINLHRGMWLWSDVLIRVSRDFRSGQWIADNLSGDYTVRGKVTGSAISAGGTGSVNVWRGVASVRTVTGVRHDWMAGATGIATDTELLMKWFPEDNVWRITEIDCG